MKRDLPTGQTLAFERYGSPEATPVVLIHALSANRQVYGLLIEDLDESIRAEDIQLLNVDLRGHGESSHATPESYDAVSYAADVAALVDIELGRPAAIVSESLGGLVGVALAARRPDLLRGLFLEDPPLFLDDEARREASPISSYFPEMIAGVRLLQARNASPAEYETLMSEVADPDELAALCVGLSQWDPETMQAAIDGLLWKGFDPTPRLKCPLTILAADPAGGDDVFTAEDAERVLAANPQAHIEFAPGASHSVRSTARDVYLSRLKQFLRVV